jgi:glycosyltransferase involved in cell wall biosynthesis
MSGPDVSVVIPCFRSRDTIARTLESILQQDFTGTMEVLVADSSDDDTAQWIRQNFPNVTVHHSNTRLRPGPARNFGVAHSRGRFIAFIDADAQAASNWLTTLYRCLAEDSSIVMISAAVANANPQTDVSRTLYWLEFSDFLPRQSAHFCRSLSSSNLLIRRQDFLAVNGFNPEYGMSEDMVFSLAIGRGLYLETATHILHRHRTDWAQVKLHLRRLGYWSGRFRAKVAVSGSWLRRVPFVSFGLTPYRLFQVLRRLVRCRQRPWRDLPKLVRGLWEWNHGFYRGIRQLEEE